MLDSQHNISYFKKKISGYTYAKGDNANIVMFSGSNINRIEQIMSLIEAKYHLVIRNFTVILKISNFFTNFILMACLFKLYQANCNTENSRSK